MTRRKSQPLLGPDDVAVILDSVADGVFTTSPDFTITSFNSAAERITGFSAEEAIGQPCYNIFRSSVCQGDCLLAESIRSGRSIMGLELTILNRSNEEIPISVSTAVLRDKQGEVIGGVETFRDLRAVESLRQEIRRRHTLGDMISKNHKMEEIFALVPDVAASSATVLIQGDTGTGKELLARAIHHASPRADRPFVRVNCGALPDTLLESELFGHVAGAFTDARKERKGRFEAADGGTIFLDEIGDTSPAMQVKLLRVLAEGHFEPLGSSETRSVDVRVIAATHRDLRERIAAGQFREDLFYRINTVLLHLPPLKARREDIPMLTEHFISRFNGLTGKSVRRVSAEAAALMVCYDWPGNIRELEHAIEHAFVLVKGPLIDEQHLPSEIRCVATSAEPPTAPFASPSTTLSVGAPSSVPAAPSSAPSTPSSASAAPLNILAAGERDTVEAVLNRNRWNRTAACRELGISRTTLWRKMRRLGITSPLLHG